MAIRSNDARFVKEFKEMMQERERQAGRNEMYSLGTLKKSLSNLRTPLDETEGEYGLIRGISQTDGETLSFNMLNNSLCKLLPSSTPLHKRMLLDGGITAKKADGSVMYREVAVPKNCVAIISPIKLKERVDRGTNGGVYRFVDTKRIGDTVYYIYILPKTVVYKANMCSLIITTVSQRKYYTGIEVALQNGTYLYIYVVPYRKENGEMLKVVHNALSCTMNNCIDYILRHWQEKGILFNLSMTALNDTLEDTFRLGHKKQALTNIGIVDLPPTLSVVDYTSVGDCLASVNDVENGTEI